MLGLIGVRDGNLQPQGGPHGGGGSSRDLEGGRCPGGAWRKRNGRRRPSTPVEAQAQEDGRSCTNSASERWGAVLVTDEEPPSEGEGTDAAARRGPAQTAKTPHQPSLPPTALNQGKQTQRCILYL